MVTVRITLDRWGQYSSPNFRQSKSYLRNSTGQLFAPLCQRPRYHFFLFLGLGLLTFGVVYIYTGSCFTCPCQFPSDRIEDLPSVLIQLPMFNEFVAEQVIRASVLMDYPSSKLQSSSR